VRGYKKTREYVALHIVKNTSSWSPRNTAIAPQKKVALDESGALAAGGLALGALRNHEAHGAARVGWAGGVLDAGVGAGTGAGRAGFAGRAAKVAPVAMMPIPY
jgi:hypothetical protein